MGTEERVEKLIQAFVLDGYDVDRTTGVKVWQDSVGIAAVHKTASTGRTGQRKKAYYVEGSPFVMGYLTGVLAEPDVSRMCGDFNERVIFAFVGIELPDEVERVLGELLDEVVAHVSRSIPRDLPVAVKEELDGLLAGCRAANGTTRVSEEGLGVLNYGFDGLLSIIYTGLHPTGRALPALLRPNHFRVPFMCNGFSIGGSVVEGGGHFLGRDFMFPTANAFQNTACHTVRHPSVGLPTVSVTAPGMVGSITALNLSGVGGGVNMLPGGACDPGRPGLNSLLLLRHAVETGANCDDAVAVIEAAQRGVSWAYILGDGSSGKACVVEAGRTCDTPEFLTYPPRELLPYLPDHSFLDAHPSGKFRRGLMVRWNAGTVPPEYLQFNEALFRRFGKRYDPSSFAPDGFIDGARPARNCPGNYYFAPPRELADEIVLVTNHFLIPEMRLTAMKHWTNEVSKGHSDDIQWRYDELCRRLMSAVRQGPVSRWQAREIIDFLNPSGDFPSYYNAKGQPLDQVQVQGSVSLLDLVERSVESRYGYYSDDWVKITLPNYC